MGLCASGLTPEQRDAIAESDALDRVLNNQSNQENKVIKLLLLGTGESGKSTIFKQMQILYQSGFSDFEKSTFRQVIRRNAVESMQTLLHGVGRFGLRLSTRGQLAAAALIRCDPLAADFWMDDIITHIRTLWPHEPAILQAYQQRAQMQLLDSSQYLFENIDRIGAPDYTPNSNDILRARLRTSGIVERVIPINSVDFKFIDVGGQRNERRKWIHCFDGVTAIIYVSAISEFDQVLYEDEKENRLQESVRVFETICNNKNFTSTAMILFMNKIDLFEAKVRDARKSIRSCFPEYRGGDTVEESAEYIRAQFLKQNQQPKKLIFSHITCATDTENVLRVFEACKVVILQENLRKLGLT